MVPESVQQDVLLLFTISIVAYTVSYTAFSRPRSGFDFHVVAKERAKATLIANADIVLALAVICYSVLGYYELNFNINESVSISSEYWLVGIAREFSTPLLVLASISQILKYGTNSAVRLVLLIQVIFGLSMAMRAMVVFPAIITLVVIRQFGLSMRKIDSVILLFFVYCVQCYHFGHARQIRTRTA